MSGAVKWEHGGEVMDGVKWGSEVYGVMKECEEVDGVKWRHEEDGVKWGCEEVERVRWGSEDVKCDTKECGCVDGRRESTKGTG